MVMELHKKGIINDVKIITTMNANNNNKNCCTQYLKFKRSRLTPKAGRGCQLLLSQTERKC